MLRKIVFKSNVAVALLLSALVAVAYAPIVILSFLSDDYVHIYAVSLPEGGTNWGRVLEDFHSPVLGLGFGLYRPLYTLSFAIDYSLYGIEPLGYHLTNLALHAVSSFFVYLIALELVPGERKRAVAISAGAIFALHPIHPEVVTWISGRLDVICAALYLPALLFFLRWLRTEQRFYFALSLGFFAVSLLSKETAAALPGLLFLCALYKRREVRTVILSMVPFAGILGVYLLFRSYILVGMPNYYSLLPDWNIIGIFSGFLYWTLHMFFPLNLNLLPDEWVRIEGFVLVTAPPQGLVEVISIALIAGSIIVAHYLGRAEVKLLILLFALYVISFSPVFKGLSWGPHVYGFYGSRWLYIPSAFLSIFIAYVVWSVVGKYARGRPLLAPSMATGLVCLAFLAMLVANNGVWLQAGEIAREHLESGQEPEFPLFYKGAYVFTDPERWEVANRPLFKEP